METIINFSVLLMFVMFVKVVSFAFSPSFIKSFPIAACPSRDAQLAGLLIIINFRVIV